MLDKWFHTDLQQIMTMTQPHITCTKMHKKYFFEMHLVE